MIFSVQWASKEMLFLGHKNITTGKAFALQELNQVLALVSHVIPRPHQE